jgi:hypothetical protein
VRTADRHDEMEGPTSSILHTRSGQGPHVVSLCSSGNGGTVSEKKGEEGRDILEMVSRGLSRTNDFSSPKGMSVIPETLPNNHFLSHRERWLSVYRGTQREQLE